jgi:hypothetical protein
MDDGFTEVTAENNETWDRQATITGKLVDVKSGVGPNESMLYTLETEDGRIGVWGSTVLDTKMAGIQRNSMVKIVPQGETKSEKTGRKYQDFKIYVKAPAFEEVIDAGDELIDLDDI